MTRFATLLSLVVGAGGCAIPFFPPPTYCDETPVIDGSGGVFTGSTLDSESLASPDPTNCNSAGPANEDIFTLELSEESSVHLDTFGSSFDTVLYFRSDCEDVASEQACNDDASGSLFLQTTQSSLDLDVDAGTYFVFVDGYNGDQGEYSLNVSIAPPGRPAGDQCPTADPILAGTVNGSTAMFADDTAASCGGDGAADAYMWLMLIDNTTVTLEIESADFDTILSVRRSCLEPESEMACDDDGGGAGGLSRLDLGELQPGTYVIVIDGADAGESGEFALAVTLS